MGLYNGKNAKLRLALTQTEEMILTSPELLVVVYKPKTPMKNSDRV